MKYVGLIQTSLLAFIFLTALALPLTGVACSGACATDSDCSGNACRYCDTDYGFCADCCEFTEEVVCPTSACTWQYGECRNVSGTSCGISVPETPKSYRHLFFIALALGLGAAGFWYQRRFRIASKKSGATTPDV